MIPDRQELRKILLVPLDPVHDVGIKMIGRTLKERGHDTELLPPDLSLEEVVLRASEMKPDYIMVSRTISYGTAEMLSKLADLCDAAGLREKAKLVVGGLSIRPEMAQEFGFDACFGSDTSPQDVLDYIEGRTRQKDRSNVSQSKVDLTEGFSYSFRDSEIGDLCRGIAGRLLEWATKRTSPGVERARVRLEMAQAAEAGLSDEVDRLRARYASLCGGSVRQWYENGTPVPHTRPLSKIEISELLDAEPQSPSFRLSQSPLRKHNVMVQYGTGCPVMDAYHIRLSLAWGARGVIHFDPSWGARTEGLLEEALSHEHDGTVLTLENLKLIKKSIGPGGLWQIRAHRGLNTPETVVLAHLSGADLTKINIVYGSLGAGTDPERLSVDGVEALSLAARFGLPYDVVTNEELCGVPAAKAFAGMLVVMTLGAMLGGRPILQPLFANSPEVMVGGLASDNFIDFNVAKVKALQGIVDAPIWPGAPVGFLTQTADRCQSATMTALHAALALSLGLSAATIASSDEAYAGGPISAQARTDTLKATAAALRFLGSASINHTPQAKLRAEELRDGIASVLKNVWHRGDFVAALYQGLLGDSTDGAYPGRAGRGTVVPRETGSSSAALI